MRRDIRRTPIYAEATRFYERALSPGIGRITGVGDLEVGPGGRALSFTGSVLDSLTGPSRLACYRCDLADGSTTPLTGGCGASFGARHAPDGRSIAFLSNRAMPARFQTFLLGPTTPGDARPLAEVPGTAELLCWHPDGRRLIVQAAGQGADQTTAEGAKSLSNFAPASGDWRPAVEPNPDSDPWRRLYAVSVDGDPARAVSPHGINVWEFTVLGAREVAIIASDDPREQAWYGATLRILDLESGAFREIHRSRRQLGHLAASPSGATLAFCEALASDRGLLAGTLRLWRRGGEGAIATVQTRGVDVSSVRWLDDARLLVAGVRDLETVVAVVNVGSETWAERYCTDTTTCGTFYPEAAPVGGDDFVIVEESTLEPPALVHHGRDGVRVLFRTAHDGTRYIASQYADMRPVRWESPDGRALSGWLLVPNIAGATPLVADVHGGPVWTCRPQWHGRLRQDIPLLLASGFAVFFPNFRGSSGRGSAFMEAIVGDMGGGDAADVLAGIDRLIADGSADPRRLAAMGASYGGFAACWLPCIDTRFRAAVAVSPVTNWLTQHHTSNIPHFDALFLGGEPGEPRRHMERSPVFHARQHRTPTLMLAGALDRATPPEQALEFEQTLREFGVPAEAVIYPLEGHGPRTPPAVIDATARTLAWLRRFVLEQPSGLELP